MSNGVSIYDKNYVWGSDNPDGYPKRWSYETPIGESESDKNYVIGTPGYASSNITYPDYSTLDEFIAKDCRAIGNGGIAWGLIDESALTDKLIKLEIQAFEGSESTPQKILYENNKSIYPCVYAYEVIEYETSLGRNTFLWHPSSTTLTDRVNLRFPI